MYPESIQPASDGQSQTLRRSHKLSAAVSHIVLGATSRRHRPKSQRNNRARTTRARATRVKLLAHFGKEFFFPYICLLSFL